MADNIKYLKNRERNYNLDDFSLVYPQKKSDSFAVAIFVILVLAGIVIADINLYKELVRLNKINETNFYSNAMTNALLFCGLILLISVSLLFLFIFFKALASKPKRFNRDNHIYYIYKDEKDYKVVDHFSGSSVAIIDTSSSTESFEEVDQYGNPIYYAEELFDDEEDIFVNEVNSTLIAKEKARTYEEIINSLQESLLSYGINGDFARALIASMSFSPMIYLKDSGKFVPQIFKSLNNPGFVIHYFVNSSISNEKTLFNAFEYAKARPDKPIFIYIDGIPAKDFFNFMRPLYAYIDNPNDDYYLSNKGTTSYIPHNVFFLVDLKEGDYYYDISRRYLRYISILTCHIGEVDAAERPVSIELSLKDIKNARRNTMDEHALSETTYKKLDNVFNLLNTANGYVLQNKIQRKIEEYSAILLSLGEEEYAVLDECMAYTLIPAAIITSEPQKLETEFHVIRAIESEFGSDSMKLTKAIIKEYISLFGVAATGGKEDE